LAGGTGPSNDVFRNTSATDSTPSAFDTILEFVSAQDGIDLYAVGLSSVGAGGGALAGGKVGWISASANTTVSANVAGPGGISGFSSKARTAAWSGT